MRKYLLVFAVLLTLIVVSCGVSPDEMPHIEIETPWIRAASVMQIDNGETSENEMDTHASSANSAVYMVIHNRGKQADTLLSVVSEVADSVEIHLSQTENDITTMEMVPKLEIPAQGTTVLKPGSYHMMLIGLRHDLNPGDLVRLSLIFEIAGEIVIDVPVREP